MSRFPQRAQSYRIERLFPDGRRELIIAGVSRGCVFQLLQKYTDEAENFVVQFSTEVK